jgi:hypothetical protein
LPPEGGWLHGFFFINGTYQKSKHEKGESLCAETMDTNIHIPTGIHTSIHILIPMRIKQMPKSIYRHPKMIKIIRLMKKKLGHITTKNNNT